MIVIFYIPYFDPKYKNNLLDFTTIGGIEQIYGHHLTTLSSATGSGEHRVIACHYPVNHLNADCYTGHGKTFSATTFIGNVRVGKAKGPVQSIGNKIYPRTINQG